MPILVEEVPRGKEKLLLRLLIVEQKEKKNWKACRYGCLFGHPWSTRRALGSNFNLLNYLRPAIHKARWQQTRLTHKCIAGLSSPVSGTSKRTSFSEKSEPFWDICAESTLHSLHGSASSVGSMPWSTRRKVQLHCLRLLVSSAA